jgi:WD40 repeat protein
VTWAEGTTFALTAGGQEYLRESTARRDAEDAAEEARRSRETALERRSIRRSRALIAVFAVAALVAGSLTVIATDQSERAQAEARVASARELAAAAVANLETDQQLSLMLAIEAVERTRSVDGTVLREAEEALHRALTAQGNVLSIPGSSDLDPTVEVADDIDWGPEGLFLLDGVFASAPRPLGVVDLRDERTGEIVRSLPGHDAELTGAAFSPDGSMLATTGEDGLLKVWDLSSDDVIRVVRGPLHAWAPSFSEDGSRVAAAFGSVTFGTEERRKPNVVIRVVDLDTGEVITFPALRWVNDISLSPDGRQVVAVSGRLGDPIYRIEIETGTRHEVAHPEGHAFLSVAWSPDGRHIAAGGWDPAVSVMDANGRLEFFLRGHTDAAYWLDWSLDGTRLLTGSADGTARIWELTRQVGTEVQTFSARAGEITGVAFSPDGTQVMTRSENSVLDLWDLRPAGHAEVANVTDAAEIVNFLSDGRSVTTAGLDGSLSILDLETGEQTRRPTRRFEPRFGSGSLDFNPDGGSVAIEDYFTGPVTVRNAESGAVLLSTDGQLGFDWSPDGRFGALNNYGASIEIIDGSERRVALLESDGFRIFEGVEFGPGGLVAFPAGDETHGPHVKVWDWTRDAIVAELPVSFGGDAMAFDADGSRIAIGTADTTIWDVRTERLLLTLPSRQDVPGALAFSPDGSRLAEQGPDGTVQLFDTSSGALTLVLQGHDEAGGVVFSPDGAMLATAGGGLVRIWALDIDDLLEIARQNVTRSLTDEECLQYLHVDSCPA